MLGMRGITLLFREKENGGMCLFKLRAALWGDFLFARYQNVRYQSLLGPNIMVRNSSKNDNERKKFYGR